MDAFLSSRVWMRQLSWDQDAGRAGGNTSPPQPLFPLQEFLCGVPLPRACQEQCVPVAGNW